LDFGPDFDKKVESNHSLPEFLKRNYPDSIKGATSKDHHITNNHCGSLKDKYMSNLRSSRALRS
jgi:hypothetical protein